MRKEILSSYLQSMERTKTKFSRVFRNVVEHNTDRKDQNEVSYQVTKQTLSSLRTLADEKIGYLPKELLGNPDTVFEYKDIEEIVEKEMTFSDRGSVEADRTVVQFIPIAIIKDSDSDRFLVGTKAQRATSPKSPEKGKILSYFGGHVREEDSTFLPGERKLDIMRQCLYREVKEELGLDIDPDEITPKCIWVRDGSISEQHIAVAFLIERPLSMIKITVDGEEFARFEKKGRTGTGDTLRARDILKGKIDSWTKNIMENYIFKDEFSEGYQPTLFKD